MSAVHERDRHSATQRGEAPARPRRSFSALGLKSEDWYGYLYIAPWLIGFFVFTFGPFVAALYLSFTSWDIIGSIQWVGLQNYVQMLTAERSFWKALLNTAIYVVVNVPGVALIALALAVLLNQRLRGIVIYRTVFYLPAVTSGVATAFVWMLIFNGRYGLLNAGLATLGIEGPNWLYSLTWSLPALIIMSLWNVGTPMIIYLAAIQGVPSHLYDAVAIDGGGAWARFRHVTMPMITPAIFFNIIIQIIGSFQVFTTAYVITGGGPGDATLFYVLYLYQQAFQNFQMGYATALAWVLFLIIVAFTFIQFGLARRWVYYEGASLHGRF